MTENRKVVVKDAPERAEEVQADYAAVVEASEPVHQEESVGIEPTLHQT